MLYRFGTCKQPENEDHEGAFLSSGSFVKVVIVVDALPWHDTRAGLLSLNEDPDPPVEYAAIWLAQDTYPTCDASSILASLDQLGSELKSFGDLASKSPLVQARSLADFLHRRHGFVGDEDTYSDPRNSYLNEVLTRKKGIPISLSVVAIAVGSRAGVQVEGIGFPGHFLARVGGPEGVFIDPFHGFRPLSSEELHELARRYLGPNHTATPDVLGPVSTKALIVRMLANLKRVYEERGDHARALVVCDRLVDLAGEPRFLRDRGLHALALGSVELGRKDIRRYLEESPNADDFSELESEMNKPRSAPLLS